jgi:hypothetical protein
MPKVRVPVTGTIGKAVLIESGATVGAKIGTDLQLPDGTTPSLTELAAALATEAIAAEQTRSFQQLVDSISPSQVPEAAVTQHEAALTILETQITDGAILAREGDDANFAALTATSYGGITEANLVDKSATEVIAGDWEHTGLLTLAAGAVGAPSSNFTGDPDTGPWSPGADIYAISVGAVEAIRYTEVSDQILADHSMEAGITASTTQTQGQRPLLSSYNEISVCANHNDVVTMPPAATGRRCLIINKGARRLQLFPESGDDIGAGIDASVTIKSDTSLLFVGIDSINWHDVATRLESLQGVDLTDAADDDLLVLVSGIWKDTEGLLTWNGTKLKTDGVLFVQERAAAIADVTGYGQLWIKDTTPNELWFTDDAGTDHQVAFV